MQDGGTALGSRKLLALGLYTRQYIPEQLQRGMTRKGAGMGTAQVEFTEEELLADLTVAEPLIAGGVRCHGGFDDEGRYVSPRTRFRLPAIARGASRTAHGSPPS